MFLEICYTFVRKWFPVAIACRAARLRKEQAASKYWRYLSKYWITCRGQRTRGDLAAWGIGDGLLTPHVKDLTYCEVLNKPSLILLRLGTSDRVLWMWQLTSNFHKKKSGRFVNSGGPVISSRETDAWSWYVMVYFCLVCLIHWPIQNKQLRAHF